MRHTRYKRLVLETGEVHDCEFEASHFHEAGLPKIGYGMPNLEALELINKWNRSQMTCRKFLYWLD